MTVSLKTLSLSIGYKNQQPLAENLNLNLLKGKLTAIIGCNGCGKSTLIKTFLKIIKPSDGKIFINNEDLSKITPKKLSEKISVVLTDKLSSENFKAFDIIALGRSPYTGFFGRLNDKDLSKINSVAKKLKIETILDKNFYELSDGQKQKILIAKALVQETEIIILDEPTSFLDFKAKDEIFSLLKKITEEQNTSILVSTHDIFSAIKYADEFWIFDKNNVRCTKADIINEFYSFPTKITAPSFGTVIS